MTKEAAYAALEKLDRQIVLLDHIEATLAWDQEISLSEQGVEDVHPSWMDSRAAPSSCQWA